MKKSVDAAGPARSLVPNMPNDVLGLQRESLDGAVVCNGLWEPWNRNEILDVVVEDYRNPTRKPGYAFEGIDQVLVWKSSV